MSPWCFLLALHLSQSFLLILPGIWGPLVGALFLTPLAEFTRSLVRTPPTFLGFIEGRSGVDVMIFGALLIVVVLFMPDGIVGAVKRLWNRIRKPDEAFAQPQATD